MSSRHQYAHIDGCCADLIPQTTTRINLILSFERNNQIGCKNAICKPRGSCFCLRTVFPRNGKAYVNNRIPYVRNSAEYRNESRRRNSGNNIEENIPNVMVFRWGCLVLFVFQYALSGRGVWDSSFSQSADEPLGDYCHPLAEIFSCFFSLLI